MLQFPDPNSLGVLWAAPFCLHDSSSGSSMLLKLMLEQLSKRGMRCHALAALTFDAKNGTASFPNFDEQLKQGQDWFDLNENGVSYEYLKTASLSVQKMTREEEAQFYGVFLYTLENFKPDMLLIYGGGVLEISIIAECKRRGIATVVVVPNGNYANYNFPNVDMLITEVPRSARLYYDNSRMNIIPTGTFIEPQKVLVQGEITPKYITLINPHLSKGISIFLRLARMANKKHPEWKFLVVESRGTWAQALTQLKQNPKDFSNVSVAQHTNDIRLVYEQTKLLLAPSLLYENFGRVAAEAVMNGIPVISSTSGGLPDSVNGGGMCVPAPQKCHEDFGYFPSAEELEEWFEALETMLDPKNYPEWQKKAKEAGKKHDIETSTDTLLAYIKAMFEGRASVHPQYFLR